ncbi:hypothetical protein [Pectobacterium parmentieri]|uniref:hypothetical protein n=1 Tax=Pectobacterium parmentieri TaxID=1905730 RepID=UPI0001B100A3|nr:hypothetical protein [Pectobacterium parmentieri]ACX90041.1 conserved hypothetical protein [Pectobacterium parmentieri WPP163]AYH07756.1 cell wall assembly/cell proliferation coordinating protein [Pectobacterium parmentieri]AYH16508.1 cell wall assembly/cell proliferation coordinating protein [Pectobacterium parmentieri]AYH20950.1 cell wall assembly/cell proliferation coordinating protein [Pectobacterium parmentieri]AYH25210.1 cell wall assembly/cell proliferation coordinating protein [Pect
MLLELTEIESKLHEKFSIFEGDMDDLTMKKGGFSIDEVGTLEKRLNITLHDKFKKFVLNYNLNDFSLGSFMFGNGGSYLDKLFELNSKNDLIQWWGEGERPKNLLLVTYNDPYSVLLEVDSGRIYAITDESDLNNIKPISFDFCFFFRGVGTSFLNKIDSTDVEKLVGSEDKFFWSCL